MNTNLLAGTITLPKTALAHDFINRHPANYKSAYADLWAWANDRQRTLAVGTGRAIKLDRGQLAYSQSTLAKLWRWSPEKVKAYLVELQNEGLITFDASNTTTIITVIDYAIHNRDTTPEPTAEPSTETDTETDTNSATNSATKAEQKGEVGRGRGKCITIPDDREVAAFCSSWPGDMARGIPAVIPEGWWTSWLSFRLLDLKKWPDDWQRCMVLSYRSDFANRHPKIFSKKTATGSTHGETRERGEILQQLAQARAEKNAASVSELLEALKHA